MRIDSVNKIVDDTDGNTGLECVENCVFKALRCVALPISSCVSNARQLANECADTIKERQQQQRARCSLRSMVHPLSNNTFNATANHTCAREMHDCVCVPSFVIRHLLLTCPQQRLVGWVVVFLFR